MEELDSLLFPIPGLVDYRACFDGKLNLHCRCLGQVTDTAAQLLKNAFPDLETVISWEPAAREHRPLYLGKRHIL